MSGPKVELVPLTVTTSITRKITRLKSPFVDEDAAILCVAALDLCDCLNIWYTGDEAALKAWVPRWRPAAMVKVEKTIADDYKIQYVSHHSPSKPQTKWTLTGKRRCCWITSFGDDLRLMLGVVVTWAATAGGLHTTVVDYGAPSGRCKAIVMAVDPKVYKKDMRYILGSFRAPCTTLQVFLGPPGQTKYASDRSTFEQMLPACTFDPATIATAVAAECPHTLDFLMYVQARNDMVEALNNVLSGKHLDKSWKKMGLDGVLVSTCTAVIGTLVNSFEIKGEVKSRGGFLDEPRSVDWCARGSTKRFRLATFPMPDFIVNPVIKSFRRVGFAVHHSGGEDVIELHSDMEFDTVDQASASDTSSES